MCKVCLMSLSPEPEDCVRVIGDSEFASDAADPSAHISSLFSNIRCPSSLHFQTLLLHRLPSLRHTRYTEDLEPGTPFVQHKDGDGKQLTRAANLLTTLHPPS